MPALKALATAAPETMIIAPHSATAAPDYAGESAAAEP